MFSGKPMATSDTIRLLDPTQAAAAEEREVSLVELIGVLAAGWRRIFGFTALAMAAMCGIAFLIPVSYTAQAVIMPPQQDQQSQAMMMGSSAMMGGLAGLTAVTGAGLLRNPAEMYIGILKSRTIADGLIRKFNLQKLYARATMIDTRNQLARRTTFTTGRDGLIYIRVDDPDRKRSAEMANAYVDELHAQGSRLALTSAAQRRVFFEQQLGTEKQALADAEVALKKTQQSSGLIYPSGQSEALIRSDAQLRAGIASREVQLQSMRMFATAENPQVQMIESELSEMRAQLAKIESGGGSGALDVSARSLPETGLEYVRRLREVKYHETLFELLSRQYEAARIDEAKLAPVIQVVDAAVAPDKKSWPPRAIFVLAAGTLALIAACFVALFQDHRRTMRPGR
jgi:uncharacterized protein involved in exopolysaccharide biosynthesis